MTDAGVGRTKPRMNDEPKTPRDLRELLYERLRELRAERKKDIERKRHFMKMGNDWGEEDDHELLNTPARFIQNPINRPDQHKSRTLPEGWIS